MTQRLGWDDLIIKNLPEQDCLKWLSLWTGWVTGRVQPLYMSKFGDWFLRHPDGSTSELSVLEGTHIKLATTPEEFVALMNTPEWQEDHLLSLVVFQLHKIGLVPAEGQCYGFEPPPMLSGKIEAAHAMIMPIGAWQSVCAQLLGSSPTADTPPLK